MQKQNKSSSLSLSLSLSDIALRKFSSKNRFLYGGFLILNKRSRLNINYVFSIHP